MRKLMWFTVGFGAACAFCAYRWICNDLLLPAVIFAVLFVAGVFIGKHSNRLKIAAVVCLGISLGLGWFQVYNDRYLSAASQLDGKIADVTLYCTDYSYETDYGSAVDGFLYLNGLPCRAKFYVRATVEMEPGDVLSGGYELRVTTQDSEQGATHHAGKGIFLLGYQRDDAELLKPADRPFWAYPPILRQRIIELIDSIFPEQTAFFAKALMLGDRSGIDYEWNTVFKASGIMHIIAVSGLHVTILFTLINILCLKRRWLVALLGIPALILFAAVAGFTPSITRACIMQCLMICAMLINKEYDGPSELAFASFVMLIVNPLVITSVSFQLSVGCMFGIFFFQKRIYDWICGKLGCEKQRRFVRIKRWFASSISVTLAAISLTTPLNAFYFDVVSLVGAVTNLLVLWAVSLIFCGIIAACIASFFSIPLGVLIAKGISLLIKYVLWVSKTAAAMPIAAVYTGSIYLVAWMFFVYALLAIFLLSKEKRVGHFVLSAILTLALCVGASYLESRMDDCRVTVLDVGQGQCILLQGAGKTYVVDCGGDYDTEAADLAADTLLSQGIRHVDGLILTHFDRDHAGGAAYLMSRIDVNVLYIPDHTDEGGIRAALEADYARSIFLIEETVRISYEDTCLSLFPSLIGENGNDASVAVLFQSGNCDILITGDRNGFGERLLLKEVMLPQLEILIAGHHGSADSTCEELLAATNPAIVAISVGENSYGHPAKEVLDRLQQYGCVVYRTDLQGNLIFRR